MILSLGRLATFLLSSLSLLASPLSAANGPLNWDPSKTKAFIIGTLEWQDAESLAPFPKTDRRDAQLVAWLKKSGVPAAQIVYLQDQKATQAAIDAAFTKLLATTQAGDQLIVYYCGHGYPASHDNSEIVLGSYDAGIGGVEGWALRELVGSIEGAFSGDRVAVFLDCCHSGGIETAVRRYGKSGSYAVMGSSTSAETSTGNWTFTEGLLRALQGDPQADLNQDGTTTWGELAQFMQREMLFAEEQKPAAFAQQSWKESTPIAKARPVTNPKVGAHVSVKVDGEDWKARVVEAEPDRFKVFYYGYEAADQDWVEASQVTFVQD